MGRAVHNHGLDGPCGCAGGSNVIDSRPHVEGGIWRRRRCKACKLVFTTHEAFCQTVPTVVREVKHPKAGQPRQAKKPEPLPPVPRNAKPVPAARQRIEDMRMERELEQVDGY
jgi:hypothetical protein